MTERELIACVSGLCDPLNIMDSSYVPDNITFLICSSALVKVEFCEVKTWCYDCRRMITSGTISVVDDVCDCVEILCKDCV